MTNTFGESQKLKVMLLKINKKLPSKEAQKLNYINDFNQFVLSLSF